MINMTSNSGWTSLFYLFSLCFTAAMALLLYDFSLSMHESFIAYDRPLKLSDSSRVWDSRGIDLPPRVDYAARTGVLTEAPIICFLIESGIQAQPKGRCYD